MNYLSVSNFVADVLQLVVAIYALRLNRLFGATRVGWSLFCAFTLLGLLHLIQSVTPTVDIGQQSGIKIEVMYSLVSLLLLTGMVHMETLLKERMRVARQEERMRAELESEVKKKTAYLMRAIEELQLEIDARKQMEVQMEQSNTELFFATQKVKAAETVNVLLDTIVGLLENVNVSASLVSDQMKQSKIANVVRMGILIREHAENLGDFMANDPRGQKLPMYIAQLAEHLANEQTLLTGELTSLKKKIEEILAMQQNHPRSVWTTTPAAAAPEQAPSGLITF